MRVQILTTLIVAAGWTAGTVAASDPTPIRNRQVSFVGCVAAAPDGTWQLTNAVPAPLSARSTGSSSAKASTPLAHAASTVDQPTAGAMTAKASTPIHPKASNARVNETHYALDASRADMASQSGHMVEVAGELQVRVLKVRSVRSVSGGCAQ